MTDYSGIFLRDALGDTNTLPRSDSDDTASPDIINSGTTASANPQTDYGDSYDQSVGTDLVYGKRNYLYVRGKNYAASNVVGNASLYWCYAKQLDNPSSWQQLATGGGANSSALGADTNAVAVTATPFVWAPATPSSGNPYVLIAAVSDPDNPNPVPAYMKSPRPQSFQEWQADQGGVSAMQFKAPAPPVVKSTYSFGGLLVLGNTAQQQLSITLLVSAGVVGDHISFSLDATDINGNPIALPSTQISQSNMNAGLQATVAAGLNAHFTFDYAATNESPPPHPTLTLQVAKLVSTGGGGSGDPFDPGGGNTEAVLVAQYVMTTALPS